MQIADLQSRLLAVVERHGRDLTSLTERTNETASALYRHLPTVASGDALYTQLRRSLTGIVEQVRHSAQHRSVWRSVTIRGHP